jgi:hypothetical protein
LDRIAPKNPDVFIAIAFEIDYHPGVHKKSILFTFMHVLGGYVCNGLNNFLADAFHSS